LAEAPAGRKRAVSPSRAKVAARKPSARRPRPALEEEPQTPNYALRLTEGLDDAPEADSFELSLNKALEAINAAQSPVDAAPAAPSPKPGPGTWLAALDRLPPIRLPVGPAISWRLGLPALVLLVVLMGVMSRSAGASDAPGVQLPAQQTYPVQAEAPLFAKAEATVVPTVTAPAAQPIGVQEPAGLGFDLADIGIKLVAVLALAYGSLMVLKKVGIGGAGSSSGAVASSQAVRVLSSIALAPNRSVHVIRVPGGKTLLVGATPNAVNLLADLGELGEDDAPEPASILDALKGRLH
jgi:flagellar biogenesis protein FliO